MDCSPECSPDMDTIPVELESFPVKDLPERYSIGRTILYERMNALNIVPEKHGNRGYITIKQLNLLDELNSHIKKGKTTPDFLRQHGIASEQGVYTVRSIRSEQSEQMNNDSSPSETAIAFPSQPINTTLLRLPDELVELLQKSLQQPTTSWNDYEQLELIASKGWLIATDRLLPLLGRKSIPKLDDQNRFRTKGFMFWKVDKTGNQYQWKITKEHL